MKKFHQQLGFSLLEILFIIALISIVSIYQLKKNQSAQLFNQIKITLGQIENIEESALYYYSRNGVWPADLKTLTVSTTDPISELTLTYLNVNTLCSPWSTSNPTSTISQCPNKEIYTGSVQGDYYQISIKLPDEAIAKRIAAYAPSSSTNNNTALSSIPIPGKFKGFIVSAGISDTNSDFDQGSGTKIYLPHCPKGYEGHFIISPQHQTVGDGLVSIEIGSKNTLTYDSDYQHWYYPAYNKINSPDLSNAHVYYDYFMTFCVWAGNWQISSKPTEPDGQCNSTDWLSYNGNNNGICHTAQTPI